MVARFRIRDRSDPSSEKTLLEVPEIGNSYQNGEYGGTDVRFSELDGRRPSVSVSGHQIFVKRYGRLTSEGRRISSGGTLVDGGRQVLSVEFDESLGPKRWPRAEKLG